MILSLHELQVRFFDAVRTGEKSDPSLLASVVDAGAPRAVERIEIYAGMYRARLIDVLREDFPRVLAVVGDDVFAELAGPYLRQHGSTHPSVRHFGGRFPRFLDRQPGQPSFLADLARLEWARVEVFDAADAEPLRLDDLRAVSPEAWPALRFQVIPACLVVQGAWPAHEIWHAAGTAGDPPIRCAPAPTVIRVWREGFAVSHAPMTAIEHIAFHALQRGASFGEMCADVGRDTDAETAARHAGALLLRWIEDGVLARFPE